MKGFNVKNTMKIGSKIIFEGSHLYLLGWLWLRHCIEVSIAAEVIRPTTLDEATGVTSCFAPTKTRFKLMNIIKDSFSKNIFSFLFMINYLISHNLKKVDCKLIPYSTLSYKWHSGKYITKCNSTCLRYKSEVTYRKYLFANHVFI